MTLAHFINMYQCSAWKQMIPTSVTFCLCLYVCYGLCQARAPSQWSQVPSCPHGTASSMARGCELWVAVIRSCAGMCWVCRGRCSPISWIPSIWSPSRLVKHTVTLITLEWRADNVTNIRESSRQWSWMNSHFYTASCLIFLFYTVSLLFWTVRLSVQPRAPDACCLLSTCQRWWSVRPKSPHSFYTEPPGGTCLAVSFVDINQEYWGHSN